MRFISWNVNGIRAVLKKDFLEIFHQFGADIFALQETKCQPGQVALELPGYHQFYSFAHRKGYSGTAIFSREEPIQVLHGLGNEYLDTEGRILAAEFADFWFVNVYTPNSQNGLARIDHRMQWDDAFRDFCLGLEEGVIPAGVPVSRSADGQTGSQTASQAEAAAYAAFLESKDADAAMDSLPKTEEGERTEPKPVIMCGDFNVAHKEIDLKHPQENIGTTGFSYEERGKMDELQDAGFVDTFRYMHPDLADVYTWWSYQHRARRTNAGWRIDYFLVSQTLKDKIVAASIYDDVEGSDHCPVGLELDI
ncbi:MAG: exodeoxyribonuclease III [Eggerthellaceae bacterium]|nr:exodeoxyribonuclease III [Eggerthellaceae bacterium]